MRKAVFCISLGLIALFVGCNNDDLAVEDNVKSRFDIEGFKIALGALSDESELRSGVEEFGTGFDSDYEFVVSQEVLTDLNNIGSLEDANLMMVQLESYLLNARQGGITLDESDYLEMIFSTAQAIMNYDPASDSPSLRCGLFTPGL